MNRLFWRIAVVSAVIGASWAFAYYEGGYLAYHIWDAVQILTAITIIQLLFPLRKVHVNRRLIPSTGIEGGDTITVELALTVKSWWPWAWVAMTESLPPTLHANRNPHFVVAVWPRRAVVVHYRLVNVPRGIYQLKKPLLATGDILGLWVKSRPADTELSSMIIWPQTINLVHLGYVFRQWSGNSALSRRISEDTNLVLGIRDYVTGDKLSQIHWRTTARTGQFKVKQFEPSTQPQIRIVLDEVHAFNNEQEWELAVKVAASLVELAAHYTQPIALLWVGDGDGRIGIGAGRSHYETILNYLSSLPRFRDGQDSSMNYIPDDAIPVWITAQGLHPAITDSASVIRLGEELGQLEDLPFYLEHYLNYPAYGFSD
ncbi:MAG: DUF58 domain-containing protein [Firmicutes bacterium]|jgi:uncharacterized protein (DUF58 family)|uniref:DUF58 domain-containing protein n=1 Tax=Sulfobacillus benefaciens TaxID=453960 RepID=A0A2T2WUW9_9FIRM|nr:DUF58 domain-containing protein [Bacillota bacterium]MCL5014630.1 DUF58 domain-containing protein [Bacillota bacterium]PSR26026.1 MAG: hypothetical protein C7B43_15275 [Sulfobacillus benefaciens]